VSGLRFTHAVMARSHGSRLPNRGSIRVKRPHCARPVQRVFALRWGPHRPTYGSLVRAFRMRPLGRWAALRPRPAAQFRRRTCVYLLRDGGPSHDFSGRRADSRAAVAAVMMAVAAVITRPIWRPCWNPAGAERRLPKTVTARAPETWRPVLNTPLAVPARRVGTLLSSTAVVGA
jgi:hypothetical protein